MLGDLQTLATLATLDGVHYLAAAGKQSSSFLCNSLLICFLSLSFFANMTGLRGNLSKLSHLNFHRRKFSHSNAFVVFWGRG
jgi:hypothetical protein